MHPPCHIKPGMARPAKQSPGKSSCLGAMAIVLGVVIGLGGGRAAAQSPAETAAPAGQPTESVYTTQLKTARALETRAYETHSMADYRAAAAAMENCSRMHPE